MKFSAWYGISVGVVIILQWIFFITTGAVPQFQTTPWSMATGFMFAVSLFGAAWSVILLLKQGR